MNETPRETLRELVAKNGESLLQDPDRCEGLLKDHCAPHRREISVLVGAMEERVPTELKGSWQTAMTPEAMRARLVQRLQDHRGLAPDVADWAVDAWSYALGVSLGKRSAPINEDLVDDNGAAAAAAGVAVPPGESKEASELRRESNMRPSSQSQAVLTPPEDKKNPKKVGSGIVIALAVIIAGYAIAGRHPNPVPCANQPNASAACAPAHETPQQPVADNNHGAQTGTIPATPVNTSVELRVDQTIDSDSVAVGQQIPATLAAPLYANGHEIAPQGARAILRVTRADKAGHFRGVPELGLSLVQISTSSGALRLSSSPYVARGKSRGKDTAIKSGAGAAAGAVIGWLAGHGKGAAIGAASGAGAGMGYQAVTHAQPARIAAESVISVKVIEMSSAKR